MVSIHARYDGSLRCTATHGPTGTELSTDAPKDNHGLGEAFSPTDLVATALATCAMTIVGIVARREDIPVDGMTARVEKHMALDPRRRISRLPIEFEIRGRLTAEQREQIESAARSCPVAESIRSDIDAPMTFAYPNAD
jgi:putative redox protein